MLVRMYVHAYTGSTYMTPCGYVCVCEVQLCVAAFVSMHSLTWTNVFPSPVPVHASSDSPHPHTCVRGPLPPANAYSSFYQWRIDEQQRNC